MLTVNQVGRRISLSRTEYANWGWQALSVVFVVASVAVCSLRYCIRVVKTGHHQLMEYTILVALVGNIPGYPGCRRPRSRSRRPRGPC